MTKKTDTESAWSGAFDAFGRTFDQLKANPQPIYLLGGAYLTVAAIGLFTVDPTNTREIMAASGLEFLVLLVFLLAMQTYGLALADGKKISIAEFMRFDIRKYVFIIVTSILYSLIIAFSFLLFILPVIWTLAWFALSTLLVVDKNLGPVAALKESKRLVQNHKGKVWGIIGVSILFSIGASAVGVFPVIGQLASAALSILISVLTIGASARLLRWTQKHAA